MNHRIEFCLFQDVDIIMNSHNKQIMTAVVMILEGNHPPEVKEQTLCILANIADGNNAKDFIMSNEDILKKLTYYMVRWGKGWVAMET